MNRRGAIELLAGILVWAGFLMSLPVYGWLVWGVLRRAGDIGRNLKQPNGRRPDVSTGRLLRRGEKSDSRMACWAVPTVRPRLFHGWHRTLPPTAGCAVLEPEFVLTHFR